MHAAHAMRNSRRRLNFERGPIMMTNFNVLFLMIYFVLEDTPPLICPYICFLGTR